MEVWEVLSVFGSVSLTAPSSRQFSGPFAIPVSGS